MSSGLTKAGLSYTKAHLCKVILARDNRIAELERENLDAKREIEMLRKAGHRNCNKMIADQRDRADKLQQENARLREAMERYRRFAQDMTLALPEHKQVREMVLDLICTPEIKALAADRKPE